MTSLAIVLLAAGLGSRMRGPDDPRPDAPSKLVLPFGTGGTVVGHALRGLLDAHVAALGVVVTGHDARSVEAAARRVLRPADPPVTFVHNAAYGEGMATSLAAGVAALGDRPMGIAVALGDLPLVRPETIRALALALRRGGADAVVRPVYDDWPGHPVLFGAAHRAALASLPPGDLGARAVARSARITEVHVQDAGVALDLDTPDAYRRARTTRFPQPLLP